MHEARIDDERKWMNERWANKEREKNREKANDWETVYDDRRKKCRPYHEYVHKNNDEEKNSIHTGVGEWVLIWLPQK